MPGWSIIMPHVSSAVFTGLLPFEKTGTLSLLPGGMFAGPVAHLCVVRNSERINRLDHIRGGRAAKATRRLLRYLCGHAVVFGVPSLYLTLDGLRISSLKGSLGSTR